MTLAYINSRDVTEAMVHPDAEVGGALFFLEACSVAAVMRKTSDTEATRYKVIGGTHITQYRETFLRG